MVKFHSACLVLIGAVSSSTVWAQDQNFRIDAGLNVRHVQNANFAVVEEEEIEEIQGNLFLGATGRLENRWSYLESDLSLESRYYEVQDARNQNLLIGSILYNVGSEISPVALELGYSSEELVVDPTLGDAPFNTDTRGIASAALVGRTPEVNANIFAARIEFSQVRYDEFTGNDSNRVLALARYTRRISPITQTGLEISSRDVEFETTDRENQLYTAVWHYQTQLRRSLYAIELGQDWIETDQSSNSSLNALVSYSAQFSGQEIEFSARQWMSDTSFGDGNATGFDDLIGQDGRLGVIDQYINREASLIWDFMNICARCSLSTNLLFHEEEYEVFSEFDTTEVNLFVRFGYQPRETWNIGTRVAVASVDFDSGGFSSYDEESVQLFIGSSYFRNLDINGYLRVVHRRFEATDTDYFNSSVGVQLQYLLYSR